jgi:hypothetical protein
MSRGKVRCRLKPSAVDRILEATVAAPRADTLNVAAIDRKILRDDLDWSVTFYRLARDLGSKTLPNTRRKRRRKILQSCRFLLCLLRADDRDDRKIRQSYPLTEPDPRAVLVRLALAARSTMRLSPAEPKWMQDKTEDFANWLTKRSAVDVLMGDILGTVYCEHFPDHKPGYTTRESGTRGSQSDGPYIRFVEAVLESFEIKTPQGKNYTRSTIAKAVDNSNRGRRRRHAGPK